MGAVLSHVRRWAAPFAIFAIVAALYGSGAFEPLERVLMDSRFRLLPRNVSDQVVVVAIDSRSLRELDTWPWPRNYHAELLNRLIAAGAKKVAFDVDFSAASGASADQSFAHALARARGRVILPVFAQRDRHARRDPNFVYNSFPAAMFRRSVLLGAVNVFPDANGLVRRYSPVMTIAGAPMPSMAALLYGHLPRETGRFYLDYGIRVEKLPVLSYVDVLKGRFDAASVAGKDVIVGATAVELGDHLTVPLHRMMAGPVLQALAYECLAQGRTLHRGGVLLTLGLALLVLLLLARELSARGWRRGFLTLLGTSITIYGVGLIVQRIMPLSLDLGPALAAASGLYAFGVVRELEQHALAAFRYRISDQHRRAMMQCVLDDSFDGIVIARADGAIALANPAASRLLDCDSASMVGKPIEVFLPGAMQLQNAAVTIRQTEAHEIDDRQMPVELSLVRPDGVTKTIEHVVNLSQLPVGTSRAARGDAGLLVFIHSFRDISERKAAEINLRDAMQRALAADRAKSQFLANMSHELRTPLNAIIGFSEIIRDAALEPVGDRYRNYAGDIARSGQHLLGIINDVLDMAKIETGHLDLREEELAVDNLFASCLPIIDQQARAAGIELTVAPGAGMLYLCVDRLRIKQILVNLLSNAVKFTPAGGKVTLAAEIIPDGSIDIRVTDTGIGMKPEDVAMALEPFRQLESTFNRQYEGTGLGLPLARSLTELHGGTLHIESELGRGTTVHVRLPASRVACVDVIETAGASVAQKPSAAA